MIGANSGNENNKKLPLIPIVIGAAAIIVIVAGILVGVHFHKVKQEKAAAEEKARQEELAREEEAKKEEEEKKAAEEAAAAESAEAKEGLSFGEIAQGAMDSVDNKKCMDQHIELAEQLGTGHEKGQVIADFTFYDADGGDHHIIDFVGKPVYYNFFTSWCPYCSYEVPDMQKISEEYAAQGVKVVMIDVAETSAETDPYVQENNVDFPIYYVDDWVIAGWEMRGVPVSIVVDKYGVVQGFNEGMVDYNWMKKAVDKAVSQE